jgi:CrcB protein
MFKAMLIAGAGGFIGTCLRYLVGKLAHYVFSSPFSFWKKSCSCTNRF